MTNHTKPKTNTVTADIDAARLSRRLSTLGRIGLDTRTNGINRPGFSAADREGRAYLITEAREAGLVSTIDAAGNVLIRRATAGSARPVFMMGSHLDTVVNGGRLDGAYGVLAALEVLQTLVECDSEFRYEPVVVSFANEEGALFPQPYWGSMAIAGRHSGTPPHDDALTEAVRLAGGDLTQLDGAGWPPGSVAGYFELHIEQGPVLEREGARIGVVEAITGRAVLSVEIRGTAGHSGTTPMPVRQDALAAAARIILATEELAVRDRCRVATVGHADTYPNTPNTIAGLVRMTADLRDTSSRRLADAERAFRQVVDDVARQTGTQVDIVAATRSDPVLTCPALRSVIERSARDLGLSQRSLPSGAGHDAQMIADLGPIGMIFVPSIDGVSHAPAEDTDPADLLAGARVLLRAARHVACL